MNKLIFTTILSCSMFFTLAYSAVNFPYPQEASYGYGTINATSAKASENLKSQFNAFLTNFYTEGTCNNKVKNTACARIKHDDPSNTVSEGIGYGMIMMVYFSDNKTSYQNQFDKLWTYYQNWPNNNGLMNWKIKGFERVDQMNAATDAEFDVAIALAMAHYQFGSSANKNYLDTAKAIIAKIRQYEISTNNLHKPGDSWENQRNPSYVAPAAFEIFKEVETAQSAKWESVISANYTLLKNNQNSNSGLFSDWCNDGGTASGSYSYDAARVPWRVAWANAWYGHSEANTILANLFSKFLNSKNAADIKGPIQLNGTTGNDKNSTFLGPLTNALSYSSANQKKMNDYWDVLIGFKNEAYFSAALQILTGLLATGNMPNLKTLSSAPQLPSSSSVPPSSSSAPSSSSRAVSSSSNVNTPIVLPQLVKNLENNATIQIFDLKGNRIEQLADLPKGLYIVRVTSATLKQTFKVVVK